MYFPKFHFLGEEQIELLSAFSPKLIFTVGSILLAFSYWVYSDSGGGEVYKLETYEQFL